MLILEVSPDDCSVLRMKLLLTFFATFTLSTNKIPNKNSSPINVRAINGAKNQLLIPTSTNVNSKGSIGFNLLHAENKYIEPMKTESDMKNTFLNIKKPAYECKQVFTIN